MNESLWTVEFVSRISELALWVVASTAVALLLVETLYLLIFTVFTVWRTDERRTTRQERDQCVDH